MRITKITASLAVLLFLASKSYAGLYGLNGDPVEVSRHIPSVGFTFGPDDYTVGPGDTIPLSGPAGNNLYLTVDDTSLQFAFGPNLGSGGPFAPNQHFILIQDLSPIAPTITGMTFETDLTGFSYSDLLFTPNSVTVDIGGLNWSGGQYLDVNLQFAPEPSSCSLFGIGIAGILWRKLIARRHIKSTAQQLFKVKPQSGLFSDSVISSVQNPCLSVSIRG